MVHERAKEGGEVQRMVQPNELRTDNLVPDLVLRRGTNTEAVPHIGQTLHETGNGRHVSFPVGSGDAGEESVDQLVGVTDGKAVQLHDVEPAHPDHELVERKGGEADVLRAAVALKVERM